MRLFTVPTLLLFFFSSAASRNSTDQRICPCGAACLERALLNKHTCTCKTTSGEAGQALQIQCYQCEEMTHDCSTPDFIVNCTVNVQDMCQKEVLVKEDGIHYRKSCASSGACLIASSGYQQFCTGKLNSVCITCCNTPLCNGPRQKKRPPPSAGVALSATRLSVFSLYVLLSFALC